MDHRGSKNLRSLTIERTVICAFYPRVRRDPAAFWPRSRLRAGPEPTATFSPARFETAIEPPQLLRKEVIQPHLPIRLPCYDFIPLTSHSFGSLIPSLLLYMGVSAAEHRILQMEKDIMYNVISYNARRRGYRNGRIPG